MKEQDKKRDGGRKAARSGERKSFPAKNDRPRRERPVQKPVKPRVEPQELPDDVLVGRNAVTEALKSGRGINKILLAEGDRETFASEIMNLAKERKIICQFVERSKIESIAAGHRHQGVLAYVAPVEYAELDDVLRAAEERESLPSCCSWTNWRILTIWGRSCVRLMPLASMGC